MGMNFESVFIFFCVFVVNFFNSGYVFFEVVVSMFLGL